jgi:hypothetical protein
MWHFEFSRIVRRTVLTAGLFSILIFSLYILAKFVIKNDTQAIVFGGIFFVWMSIIFVIGLATTLIRIKGYFEHSKALNTFFTVTYYASFVFIFLMMFSFVYAAVS